MRKIAVITEARSDYGIYLPVLKAIKASPDLELNLIVTGMHLLVEHGYTADEIQKDGFCIEYALGIKEIEYYLEGSDWLVVLGDRMPMLEACIEAVKLGIPIVHIQGGDVTNGACIDESIRHAITRFAHLHFPSQGSSARRLIKWGEEAWRVTVVGPLGIYNMQDDLMSEYEVRNKLGLNIVSTNSSTVDCDEEVEKPIILVVQHPVKDSLNPTLQMLYTITAVNKLDAEVIIIYPNSDKGGREMIDAIQAHWKGKVFKNLPYLTFQSMLKASSVLVGNSSIALHEAPMYGVPVVNIGDREMGREMWGETKYVPYDSRAINQAVKFALENGKIKPVKRKVIDGPGIIIKALVETPIDDKLLRKGYV